MAYVCPIPETASRQPYLRSITPGSVTVLTNKAKDVKEFFGTFTRPILPTNKYNNYRNRLMFGRYRHIRRIAASTISQRQV